MGDMGRTEIPWPDLINPPEDPYAVNPQEPPLFPPWFTKGYEPEWAGTQNWTGYFYTTEPWDECGFATDQPYNTPDASLSAWNRIYELDQLASACMVC